MTDTKEIVKVADLPLPVNPNPIQILASFVHSGVLDPEGMKTLAALADQFEKSTAKAAYATAMVKFNGLKKLIPPNRPGKAGSANFMYADFPQLVKYTAPWLRSAGFSVNHTFGDPQLVNGKIVFQMVHCTVTHKLGHEVKASIAAIPNELLREKLSPGQLLSAAVTTAKRTSYCAILGIAVGDEGVLDEDNIIVIDQAPDSSRTPQPNTKGKKTVNEEQIAFLRERMNERGIDEKVVCANFHIGGLTHLKQAEVSSAVQFINQR